MPHSIMSTTCTTLSPVRACARRFAQIRTCDHSAPTGRSWSVCTVQTHISARRMAAGISEDGAIHDGCKVMTSDASATPCGPRGDAAGLNGVSDSADSKRPLEQQRVRCLRNDVTCLTRGIRAHGDFGTYVNIGTRAED
jgi:hypothetical protein